MKNNVKLFVKTVSEIFSLQEPIFEIGSLQVPGQEGYADLRPFFSGKRYIGCDMRSGLGVDRTEDVENLSMDNESVGTILMLDTLAHIKNCSRALDEIYRVLKKEGIVVVSSILCFPICRCPEDYWRFTSSGLNHLLRDFPFRIIGTQGASEFPHSVFGIGFKSGCEERITRYFNEFNAAFSDKFQTTKISVREKICRATAIKLGLDKKYPAIKRVLSLNEIKLELYYLGKRLYPDHTSGKS